MMVTDGEERALRCSSTQPASCADITHACQLGLVKLLADGSAAETPRMSATRVRAYMPADVSVTPPPCKFKKNAPDWYEEMYE
ncbi:hypothetical protein [Streptomyces decoyicus]|uniref:hypothetical protein n=1 Tax=Streptomyces decoyicus TaxID=249567 RepID=UPI0033B0A107